MRPHVTNIIGVMATQPAGSRKRVLIVDDSATIRAAIASAVLSMGMEPLLAASGEQALELFASQSPDVVLLDVTMPGIDGYETARRLRAASPARWLPILFLSSSEYDQDLERAIESGGDDYLTKPVSPVVLSAKIRALQRLEAMQASLHKLTDDLASANLKLEALSRQDGLTGIANRRAFDDRLRTLFPVAQRGERPLALVLCDVDHFKEYNDRHGHPTGDACLKRVAATLREVCRRESDLAARFGGEEFVVLLPETPADEALEMIERAREALAEPPLQQPGPPPCTFSAGVAVLDAAADAAPGDLLKRADEALYRAKALGRNRVVLAPPPTA
jgi:diguanylate cyclase (GGDEF)-like protein